jgi:hypothetical protein
MFLSIYHEACFHNIPTHYVLVTCRRLCLPVPHHIHLNVDWRKSQVLPPKPHRSVQLLLTAELPVYLDQPNMAAFNRKIDPVGRFRTAWSYTSPLPLCLQRHVMV